MTKGEKDIRWIQRLENYKKALAQLRKGASLAKTRKLSNLEKQGLIQGFEFTHELAWNVIKDFFEGRGNDKIYGSKDATRLAFKNELILNGEVWMTMISDRNLSSHTYNEEVAEEIITHILELYVNELTRFSIVMEDLTKSK